jgi:hypothetical protein
LREMPFFGMAECYVPHNGGEATVNSTGVIRCG